MSEIKNGGLDQSGKMQSLNGIGGERVNPLSPAGPPRLELPTGEVAQSKPHKASQRSNTH